MRHLPYIISSVSLIATPLAAQTDERPSLLEFLTYERLVGAVFQVGISALRTQMRVTYEGVSADLLSGRMALNGLNLGPRLPWDRAGNCAIRSERALIRTNPADVWNKVEVRAELLGVSANLACLPPPAQQMLVAAGQNEMALSRAVLDFDYETQSARLTAHVEADAPDVASVTMDLVFAYAALEQNPSGFGDPLPVAEIETARIMFEDQGMWAKATQILPPQFTQPEPVGQMVSSGLGQLLVEMNGGATPSAQQRIFHDTVVAEVQQFVETPGRIVIETTLPQPVRLSVDTIDNPRALFDALGPTAASSPAVLTEIIPAEQVRAALEAPETLGSDVLRDVGAALLAGSGVPRSLTNGQRILEPLARDGDGQAAMALARGLAPLDPGVAYDYALIAGAARIQGAVGLLDQLENRMQTRTVMEYQNRMLQDLPLSELSARSPASLRAAALSHLTGFGAPRSYQRAYFWATLAAAAGDSAGLSIQEDVEARMRLRGRALSQAWSQLARDAEQLALELWISEDLGARYRDQ